MVKLGARLQSGMASLIPRKCEFHPLELFVSKLPSFFCQNVSRSFVGKLQRTNNSLQGINLSLGIYNRIMTDESLLFGKIVENHCLKSLSRFNSFGARSVGSWSLTQIFAGKRKKMEQTTENDPELTDKERLIVRKFERRLDKCQKESTREMRKRLDFRTNILGIRHDLRNGSIKPGTVNAIAVELKKKFPDEVILIQVGDFYETMGYDALLLVEYANLNPMGGMHSDGVPRAGFPLRNLKQTLRDLNSSNISACVVREVSGPSRTNERKDRFVSGHSHPGNPYVYGHSREEDEMDSAFPDELVPVIGLARSSRGYTLLTVFQLSQFYRMEEGLTEEATLARLRSSAPIRGFLHRSLKDDISGTSRWGLHGHGGSLYSECVSREFEWYDGRDPLQQLLHKVREIYDMQTDEPFRRMESPPGTRPRPLYTSAASQIGIVSTPGVPSLLKALLPPEADKLCEVYLRQLLLHPPPVTVALAIQRALCLLSSTRSPLPHFLSEPSSKLVKLLRAREVNHRELRRVQIVCGHLAAMLGSSELRPIAEQLLLPTWLATGVRVEQEALSTDCEAAAEQIRDLLVEESADLDADVAHSRSDVAALEEFFEEMESDWRGRVRRCHLEPAYADVDAAAKELRNAVDASFGPVLTWIRSKPRRSNPRAEILFHRDQLAVLLKGKNLRPTASELSLGDIPGVQEASKLEPAVERKGGRSAKRVGDDWWTTAAVDEATEKYVEACGRVREEVLAAIRELAEDLQDKLDAITTAATFSIVAKTLALHTQSVTERGWTIPSLSPEPQTPPRSLDLHGLIPYWLDPRTDPVVPNGVQLQGSMCLLTGPNGGGKSSLLRAVFAAALLANCGLMVPCHLARVPYFDAFHLRMMSADSPADAKSSFQLEMRELAVILAEASPLSLVLVDELCKGTEVHKGAAIVGAALQHLGEVGCTGVISTHLHALLDVPLDGYASGRLVKKAMGSHVEDGRVKPTWKLRDGECRESLAFEVARREGVSEDLIQRAAQIYRYLQPDPIRSVNGQIASSTPHSHNGAVANHGVPGGAQPFAAASTPQTASRQLRPLVGEVEARMVQEYQDLFQTPAGATAELEPQVISVGPTELPPPGAALHSSVYLIQFPNGRLYVGQTDNIIRRIRTHRLRPECRNAIVSYIPISDKSRATMFETLLIRRLRDAGLHVINKGDEHHKHFGGAASHPLAPPF